MQKEYEASGKTVDEAIDAACLLANTTIDMVEVEVLEYGSKGLNVVGCVCDAETESTLELAKQIAGEHLFRNVKLSEGMFGILPYRGTPTSYFLDGEGRVLDYPIAGAIPADYTAALEDYLNGKTDEFQALLLQKVKGDETPKQTDEEQTYTVVFVDQNGEPIPEIMAAFCTAEVAESRGKGRERI